MRSPRLSIGLGSFLVALALVVAVGIGTAIAVIPNQGTYYACLTKSTGAIKVINYPKVKCAKGQKLLSWSQQGPAGPQGAQGAQGPAGPADWNAIPNIPAGFADGVDAVGYTSITQPTTFSAIHGGGPTSVFVDHPIGTDAELTIIPEPGKHLEIAEEYFWRGPSSPGGIYPDLPAGMLRHQLDVRNADYPAAPVTFKVRVRVYDTGIAPATFRQALKKVRVSAVEMPRKRR
jgi:hypothetical protein